MPNKPTVVVVAVGLGGAASEMPLPLQQRVRVASVSPPFCCPPSLSFCGLRLRAKERGAALTHSLTHSFAITSLPEFTFRCRERRGPRSLGSNLTHEQVGAAKGSASLLLCSLFSIFDPLRSVSMPSRRPVSRVFRCAFNVVVKCLGYGASGRGRERGEN